MEYPTSYHPHLGSLFFQTPVTGDPYNAWNVDVSRLRHGREVLEDGLANCVTYLQVLRKKHARNERYLNQEPLPPRKKRKKVQQSNHELSKEIKNRERDEQAFLNNLRACKANLYIAEGLLYAPAGVSPTTFDCASSTTQFSLEGLEPTPMSWKGWADDSDVSPFTTQRNADYFTEEVAPDAFDGSRETSTIAIQGAMSRSWLHRSEPADNAATDTSSSLIPDATASRPTSDHNSNPTSHARRRGDRLNDLSWIDTKAAEARIPADICTSMQGLAIHSVRDTQRRGSQTWCNTSPEHSPCEATSGMTFGRVRTNSL